MNFIGVKVIIERELSVPGGIVVADSNITKRALAQALKELMMTQPLDKISVSNICEQCGLNRKSFYYHFRDKYELVSWIYYTEFMETALKKQYRDSWEFMDEICSYFYENRIFYRKCFQQEGQNSFSEYFFSMVFSIMCDHLEPFFREEPSIEPYAAFYADAFVCAIKKWLGKKECLPPQEFSRFLRTAILGLSRKAYMLFPEENSLETE